MKAWLLLLLLLPVALSAAGQSFTDDFSAYPAGSDAWPTWLTDSSFWEVADGALTDRDRARSSALYQPAPYARAQVVEATVTVTGKVSEGWKIAGLTVVRDSLNYWHLALVEAPDAEGARHFVELSEMYHGPWLAHGEKSSRLTQTDSTGGDFAWRYDHPYRLRLELGADAISGTVSELTGERRAHIAFRLDNPSSVRDGRAGLANGGVVTRFDDFRVEVVTPCDPPGKEPVPAYRVAAGTGPGGRATGFFRVEQAGGRWWFRDPQGRPFWAIGTDHANWNAHWCEALGYAPYHRNLTALFASEQDWAANTAARLRSWGFNTLGAGHSASVRYRGLAHTEFLALGQGFAAQDAIVEQTTWTGFPNVFSPKWPQYCRKQARLRCAPCKDDPWLLGYFIDNELEWFGKQWREGGLADEALRRPADHAAKRALAALLQQRYRGDLARFNRAWGTHLVSFQALLALTEPPPSTPAALADKRAFVSMAAERYFGETVRAIREADPHHLVLGCRFAGAIPQGAGAAAGRWCDVVSINCYREADLARGEIVGFARDLARWHRETGRPLMITEWSFPALDAGLPCKGGAGQRYDTQAQRAAAWTLFQRQLFTTPFVIGSDYFMWVDEPALAISKTFPEDSNYGLVNEQNEPYPLLVAAATRLNRLIYRLHAGDTAALQARVVLEAGRPVIVVSNTGRAPVACPVRVWVDGLPRNLPARVPAGGKQRLPLVDGFGPGGHYVCCLVDPEQAIPETDRTDNTADLAWYRPGLPWEGERARTPLVVANPGDLDLEQALVWVPATAPCRAWMPGVGALTCGYDPEGRRLAVTIPRLPARGVATVFLTPGQPPALAPAAARSGLAVLPGREGEEECARLAWEGTPIAHLVPLVWQAEGHDQWVRARLERQDVRQVGDALVIRTVLSCRPGEAEVILPADRPDQEPAREFAWSCACTLVARAGRPWLTARLDWLKSDDPRPWQADSYYHYLLPDVPAEPATPGVPGYYRPWGGWWDPARQVGVGVLALQPADFHVYYWKDERGNAHPDAYRDLEVRMTRGRTLRDSQPEIVVFAACGQAMREASLAAWQQALAESRVAVKQFRRETRQTP